MATEGWDPRDTDLLWRYNAHYFDDLNAEGATSRSAWHGPLIERWLCDVPPGSSPAWDPYPLSTRLVNWIKHALAGGTLSPRAVDSMAAQARWLSKRVEWHLQGNHLWINGKALIFAGLFFEGDEADRWMRLGTRIVDRELDIQILADGGHFERSPMYHSLVLEDMLDLVNVVRVFGHGDTPLCNRILGRLPSARRWLAAMIHPDARISFFNDATFGVAPEPSELDRYAQSLPFGAPCLPADGITHLQSSGYVRLQRGPAVLIMDVGDVGPDFCPAHAHADTLAIELSLFGQRVIVNSGISCYGTGEERLRQRGTAAHSTVTVEGLDSSEVWSGFRVARRARPFGLALDDDGVRCSV
ncbi:MAG: heparinase II/III family protein, partial [Planctomycetia bacterium]